jgi:DNA-binding transcriptional MerR regulator
MNSPVDASDASSLVAEFTRDCWTIGDMARHFDVSLRTLRFYEDRGLLHPLRHGSVRFYDSRSRRRLQTILNAKKLGFTLSRIAALVENEADAELGIASVLAPDELEAQIATLVRQRADLDTAIVELRTAHDRLLRNRESQHSQELQATG